MTTIRPIKAMQQKVRKIAASGKTIALVPTMGFLHDGHLSLIRRARKLADVVVVSIFVNPAQFAPHEDLNSYPRDEKGDLRKIRSAGGDIVFVPTAAEIYPDGFQTMVTVGELSRTLEGSVRPGHFTGVATIVAKLFNITRPDVAVFGMKDFQQVVVLQRMTADLGYPIRFVVAPTVRENDGLAMSSRNSYFTPEQRPDALALYRALSLAARLVKKGLRSTPAIEKQMRREILELFPKAQIDYIAFTDMHDLTPVPKIRPGTVCSLAVRIHGVRLIDNLKLA